MEHACSFVIKHWYKMYWLESIWHFQLLCCRSLEQNWLCWRWGFKPMCWGICAVLTSHVGWSTDLQDSLWLKLFCSDLKMKFFRGERHFRSGSVCKWVFKNIHGQTLGAEDIGSFCSKLEELFKIVHQTLDWDLGKGFTEQVCKHIVGINKSMLLSLFINQ